MQLPIIAFALALAVSATAHAAPARPTDASTIASPNAWVHRVQNACGWYVILRCQKEYRVVQRAATRFGGYVIDTNNPDYPNFRGGWQCAVIGPKTRRAAWATVRQIRRTTGLRTYAKSAC